MAGAGPAPRDAGPESRGAAPGRDLSGTLGPVEIAGLADIAGRAAVAAPVARPLPAPVGVTASAAPQWTQKRVPGWLSLPQIAQFIHRSRESGEACRKS